MRRPKTYALCLPDASGARVRGGELGLTRKPFKLPLFFDLGVQG